MGVDGRKCDRCPLLGRDDAPCHGRLVPSLCRKVDPDDPAYRPDFPAAVARMSLQMAGLWVEPERPTAGPAYVEEPPRTRAGPDFSALRTAETCIHRDCVGCGCAGCRCELSRKVVTVRDCLGCVVGRAL